MNTLSTNTSNSGELDMACLGAWTAPGQVRTLVGFRLAEWGLSRIADDLQVIVSELVTNAVRCTPDREIRVRLTREPSTVLFAVWDSSDELPMSKPMAEVFLADVTPDAAALDAGHEDGTGGRGLPIVEALSSECGVRKTAPHGKWVWARLAV